MTLRKEATGSGESAGSADGPGGANDPQGEPGSAEGTAAATPARVLVVVLHWQASHYTRACLASIRGLHYANYETLLVDNGSPDQSGTAIARQFPEVSLLTLAENRGFAGGCNAAIDYGLKHGAQWIWLLNNDTKVAVDSLELLMAAAATRSDIGALGAVVRTGAGEQFATSGPGQIDFVRAKTYLRRRIPEGQPLVEAEWLSGSNLLLNAEALRRVGRFDEDYFLYFEDTDLCYRLRRHGWQCILVPAAQVEHVGGASTEGKRAYWRAYYYTRNRMLFFFKHKKGPAIVLPLIFIAGHLARHTLVLPFRGEPGRQQLRAELLGLRDYLKGRLGKATCLDWCEQD
ncbi:MAG TPA: glycosyltransferase family 2 protein [Candidatus Obscuribacterales bacterium]